MKREEPRWISPPKDEPEKKVVHLHRPLYLSICVAQFNGKKKKKKKDKFHEARKCQTGRNGRAVGEGMNRCSIGMDVILSRNGCFSFLFFSREKKKKKHLMFGNGPRVLGATMEKNLHHNRPRRYRHLHREFSHSFRCQHQRSFCFVFLSLSFFLPLLLFVFFVFFHLFRPVPCVFQSVTTFVVPTVLAPTPSFFSHECDSRSIHPPALFLRQHLKSRVFPPIGFLFFVSFVFRYDRHTSCRSEINFHYIIIIFVFVSSNYFTPFLPIVHIE